MDIRITKASNGIIIEADFEPVEIRCGEHWAGLVSGVAYVFVCTLSRGHTGPHADDTFGLPAELVGIPTEALAEIDRPCFGRSCGECGLCCDGYNESEWIESQYPTDRNGAYDM